MLQNVIVCVAIGSTGRRSCVRGETRLHYCWSIDSQGEASDRDTTEDGSSVGTLKPHQPDPKTIVSQNLAYKTLRFQRQWYQDFPWLHFIPGVEGALCFYCRKWTSFSLTGQTELPIHEPTAKSHEQPKRLCRHAVWLGSHNGPRNVSQWAPLIIRKLEKVLSTGVKDDDVLLQYPEGYRPSLQVQ